MLEEVGPQKHGLDISLKVIAGLKDTLESCISLVSMPCVEDLVVGVYPGLQRFHLEASEQDAHKFRNEQLLRFTCILFSVISAASSFSSMETEVLKAVAIKLRSTDIKGSVYCMIALWRISIYRVSTCSCKWISRSRLGFSFSR
jgi:hypothetical protein